MSKIHYKIGEYDPKKAFPGCKITQTDDGLELIINPIKLLSIYITKQKKLVGDDEFATIIHSVVYTFKSPYDQEKYQFWDYGGNKALTLIDSYVKMFDGIKSYSVDTEKLISFYSTCIEIQNKLK